MSGTISDLQASVPDLSFVHHRAASDRSWIGLCASSFFLAEVNGVTMPFVNTYLLDQGWGYDAIGTVVALAALISWLMNLPAGFLIDHVRRHQLMLAVASLLVGSCYGLLPLISSTAVGVGMLLATAAVAIGLFGPLTSALTLRLVGHAGIDRAVGIKQGWNHAGNIAAALIAMALTYQLPVASVFYSVAAASVLAAGSVFLIRRTELDDGRRIGSPVRELQPRTRFIELLADKRVAVLLACAILFHLANAPVMPLVAQKVRHCGGSNAQVAAVVLVAQSVMIPVAVLAGMLSPRWGRKRVLSIGFAVLPVRIALYAMTGQPATLVALQALDGIGAGIFDVTAVSICAEATRGCGRFNALIGALATAAGFGGVVGPLVSGFIVQRWGFTPAFCTFAVIAAAAATLFVGWMPERYTATDEVDAEAMSPLTVALDAE